MKRIGYLMHGISYGGASRSLYLLLKGLSKQNQEIDVIIYTISAHSEEILNQFKKYVTEIKFVDLKPLYVNQTHNDSLIKYIIRKNSNVKDFINVIIQDKLDILHINTSVFPYLLRPVKEKTNIKLVVHVRELIPNKGKNILAKYMINELNQYPDALICISHNEASRFKSSKTSIVPNPFDFSKNTSIQSDWKSKNGINRKTIVISMFSNFFHLKGHISFLQALKELEKYNIQHPYIFAIIGVKRPAKKYRRIIKILLFKGDYRSKVLRYIKRNNLSQRVFLQPYTNNVFQIYNDTDIVVRPALTADPWGRDVIEAMALKKPVVATGSSEFLIKNKETGFLVSPDNPIEMAKKIEELVMDTKLREKMGQTGFARIKEICDFSRHTSKVIEVYTSITNS